MKEQIEAELRNNRLITDELEKRIDAIKTDIMNKEEALLQEERRNDALLQDKNYIEQEHSDLRAALEHMSKIYEEKN